MSRIFVTGTDTGIGKTVFSFLLMRRLYDKGFHPFYLKPVQTGCANPGDTESDAGFVCDHVPQLSQKDPKDSAIYTFPAPKAPLFAARDAGTPIDLSVIRKAVEEKQGRFSPIIIEGAGGLMVPVLEDMMMIDLIRAIRSRPILVARAGLGTINHTLLSVSELARRDLKPMGVVLMDRESPPVSEEMIRENTGAIEAGSGIPVFGVIGKISDFSDSANLMVNKVTDRVIQTL